MTELTLRIDRTDARWRLHGPIDERAGLVAAAVDVADGAALTIDLEHVDHINSLGVRDWAVFLRGVARRGVAVRLVRCSGVMVSQMNMIIDARGAAEVESFFAPFDCAACGWDGEALLETATVAPLLAARGRLEARCPDCDGVARFADFVDRYFLFLADAPSTPGAP